MLKKDVISSATALLERRETVHDAFERKIFSVSSTKLKQHNNQTNQVNLTNQDTPGITINIFQQIYKSLENENT